MTPDDVSRKIDAEIDGRWNESNLHGINLRGCIVPPTVTKLIHRKVEAGRIYESVIEVWLVLEEKPIEKDGYKIIFDEASGMFGLASQGWPSDPHPSLDGFYSDFMSAVKGM